MDTTPETKDNNVIINLPTKIITKDQKVTLALTAAAICCAGIAACALLYKVNAVTSTVDQLLLTLQDQEIISHVQIGK